MGASKPTDRAVDGVTSARLVGTAQRFSLTQARLTRATAEATGVDAAHAATLRAVSAGAVRVGDVADALSQSPSTASRLVDAMVKAGLLTRDEAPDDRRAVVLKLTAAGRDANQRVEAYITGFLGRVLATIAPDDVEAFVRGFEAFTDAAEVVLPRDEGR